LLLRVMQTFFEIASFIIFALGQLYVLLYLKELQKVFLGRIIFILLVLSILLSFGVCNRFILDYFALSLCA